MRNSGLVERIIRFNRGFNAVCAIGTSCTSVFFYAQSLAYNNADRLMNGNMAEGTGSGAPQFDSLAVESQNAAVSLTVIAVVAGVIATASHLAVRDPNQ